MNLRVDVRFHEDAFTYPHLAHIAILCRTWALLNACPGGNWPSSWTIIIIININIIAAIVIIIVLLNTVLFET
jgi:hypothetical protein